MAIVQQFASFVIDGPDGERPNPAGVDQGIFFKPQGVARIDILEIVAGVRSWVTVGTGGPVGPAGGDLAATYPSPTLNPSTATGGILGKTDAANAAVTDIFTMRHLLTAGAGAANHGTGLLWTGINSTPAVGQIARTSAIWTDATATSEDSAWTVSLRRAGAALAEMYRFNGDGGLLVGSTVPVGGTGIGLANNSTVWFRNAANSLWQPLVNLTGGDLAVFGSETLDTLVQGSLILLDSATVVLAADDGRTRYQGATGLLDPQVLTSGLNQALDPMKTQHDINSTGAATSVLLPTAAQIDDVHVLGDTTPSWATSNVTVGVQGGGTINGSATVVLDENWADRTFRKIGATAWKMST